MLCFRSICPQYKQKYCGKQWTNSRCWTCQPQTTPQFSCLKCITVYLNFTAEADLLQHRTRKPHHSKSEVSLSLPYLVLSEKWISSSVIKNIFKENNLDYITQFRALRTAILTSSGTSVVGGVVWKGTLGTCCSLDSWSSRKFLQFQ